MQVGQQARSRQPLGDGHRRLGRGDHHVGWGPVAGTADVPGGRWPGAAGRWLARLCFGLALPRCGRGAGLSAGLGFWQWHAVATPGAVVRVPRGLGMAAWLQHGQTYLWTKCSITNNDAGR